MLLSFNKEEEEEVGGREILLTSPCFIFDTTIPLLYVAFKLARIQFELVFF